MSGSVTSGAAVIRGDRTSGTRSISRPRGVKKRGTSPDSIDTLKPPSWSRRWWKLQSRTRLSRRGGAPGAPWWRGGGGASAVVAVVGVAEATVRAHREAAAAIARPEGAADGGRDDAGLAADIQDLPRFAGRPGHPGAP